MLRFASLRYIFYGTLRNKAKDTRENKHRVSLQKKKKKAPKKSWQEFRSLLWREDDDNWID